jgi:UDP-N-acetylglucosamine acyltransferase
MAMIGAGAMVAQDIPPFCMAQGDRAKLIGLNRVGMERGGISKEEIMTVRKVYRTLLVSDSDVVRGKSLKDRISFIRSSLTVSEAVEVFLSFIESSERGISRPRGGVAGSNDSDSD